MSNYSNDAYLARLAVSECAGVLMDSLTRPHVLMRPALSVDGNMYCALYGDDLVQGCAGFGPTAAAAMADFDANWSGQKATFMTPMGESK
jgi:hypothetical protein